MLADQSQVDPFKNDIWSLGCVLFELIAKRPLFYFTKNTEDIRLSMELLFDSK